MEYPNEVLRTYYAEQRAATILPGEGWLLYGLVHTLRPELIVEIGTGDGCSTLWLAEGQRGCGMLYSIDVRERDFARSWLDAAGLLPCVDLACGDSHGEFGMEAARRLSRDEAPPTLMFFDGDHSAEGVVYDADVWLPLLPAGGVAVFHDATRDDREYLGVAQVLDAIFDTHGLRRGLVFEHGCGYDAGGPHDNGLVIAQRGR